MKANRESRITIKYINTEWELTDYAFNLTKKTFGYLEIDSIVICCNTMCKKFFSEKTETLAINAFTRNSLGLS